MAKGLIGVLLALTVSCARDRPIDTRFVQFYADVVVAQETAVDSAAAAESALVVAQRHRLSPGDLTAFREHMRARPEEWTGIWEQVLQRHMEMEPTSPGPKPG